jgi:hypothetical protein
VQTLSANLTAAVLTIDARVDPRRLIDLIEFYDPDYTPSATGFDPTDAVETFASETITWNSIAYRRETISRGDCMRNMGEKTNSVTLTFSNISRYLATLATTTTIEGMLLVIRTVVATVTDDSLVLFVGRCDKPSDIDKEQFTLNVRQDFGNINQTLPFHKFLPEDPDGVLPGDPLYQGFRFTTVSGTFQGIPTTTGGFLGLFKKKKANTQQFSSYDLTPYGNPVPEVFGSCQVEGVPLVYQDRGNFSLGMWVWSKGPISAITNFSIRSDARTLINTVNHLGDLGGTGTNATEDTLQAPGIGYLSLTAYTSAAFQSALDVVDDSPTVVALIRGRKIPLPNSSGVYGSSDWTDNPVHIARFILTDSRFCNINSAFMEDSVNYLTSLHCDEPLIDDTNDQRILIPSVESPQAGETFFRYQSTGILKPTYYLYNYLGDVDVIPETEDGPYEPYDPNDFPTTFTTQLLLRKRYTCNFPITEEVRAVDLLYKTVFATFRGFMRVNKRGKYELRTEKASDATKLRASTSVGATTLLVLDVTPWKSGPDLLTGRMRVGSLGGPTLTDSEVRDLASADYSTSGNSITLTASDVGGVSLTASGATLSGGSTSVQASGTVTVGGTPAAGNTITATIDGVAVTYTLTAEDTTGTAAAMLSSLINATDALKPYIKSFWSSASPTVVTIKCLHGALTLSSATGFPTLLKAHSSGEEVLRIAMSFATNSQDVYSAWSASTLVLLGDTYLPTVLNGHKYEVTTGGTTGATEPIWPTTAGGTVASGTAVFTEVGSTVLAQAGLTRANIKKDTFKWPLGSRQASVNQIKGSFRDRRNDFALTPFKINDPVHQAQVKKIYPLEVDFSAIDNWNQTFRIGNGLLAKNREGDWFNSLATGPAGLVLEEGDLICSSDDSGGLINVVTRIEDLRIQPNHDVMISQARLYSTNMFSDDADASVIPIPTTLRYIQTVDSIAAFIDNFAIHDADALVPGFYIAVSRDLADLGDWRGWKLYADYGDGYTYTGAHGDIAAVMGTADTILSPVEDVILFDTSLTFTTNFTTDVFTAAGNSFVNGASVQVSNSGGALPPELLPSTTYFVRDAGGGGTFKLAATSGGSAINLSSNGSGTHSIKSVLEITLKYGTPPPTPDPFATVTEADLIDNPYRNLFAYGDEYLQAATVVSNGDNSFTLSDFYRGRFGTDQSQLNHSAAEDIVYLDGSEVFVPIDVSRLNLPFNYKVVTTNQNITDATPISFTWTGGTIKGHAVSDVVIVTDAADDTLIWFEGHDPDAEYEVEVWSGTGRSNPAELLGVLPVETVSSHPAQIVADSSGDGTWDGGSDMPDDL